MAMATERFFISGGTLPPDAPSYIVRQADTILFESLCDGEFCYILDTRQSGKSSLKVRTAARLRQKEIAVVDLDLTRVGLPPTPDQWYYGLLLDIGDQLNLVEPLRAFWRAHRAEVGPLQRWLIALRQVVLEHTPGRLVLFIDEIDVVRSLPFSTDEFFAAIRECYNRRSQDATYESLIFCLLGVAVPADLIRDVRTTPFNIGRRIELTDFTLEEARPLAAGLESARQGEALLQRVLYWTGGHPYLTQRLCRAVAEHLPTDSERAIHDAHGQESAPPTPDTRHPTPSLVDRLCADLFLTARARETDDNLAFVWNRILHSNGDVAALLTLYRQVWKGRQVHDNVADPLITELKLAGIVRVEEGCLRVRNRIYAQEFDAAWVRESMPDAEVRRQRAAYRRGLIRASSVYGTVVLVICALALAAVRQKHIADLNAARARTAESHARAEAARANEETANARRQLYFANMELAPREWENNRIKHLQQLLDETKDNENRSWEWDYWNRLCHLDLLTIQAYSNVASVAISPDGTQLAIPYFNGAKIYAAATGREMRLIGNKHDTYMGTVAYSPDGRRIAIAGGDTTVKIWDAQSGHLLLTLKGHKEPVIRVSFSSNGKCILTSSSNIHVANRNSAEPIKVAVKVWNAETGRSLFTLSMTDQKLLSEALSPDGRQVVTGDHDGIVRVWDVATGRRLAAWTRNDVDINSIAFSPDGRRIVTISLEGIVREWHTASGRQILNWYARNMRLVAFAPDGKRLLTGGEDGAAQVWDAQSGRLLLTLHGHPAAIYYTAFFPDGRRIVTSDVNGTVRVWDALNDRRVLRFQAHKNYAIALAFSPDGRRLVTGGGDSVARVWDAATGRELLTLRGHISDIYAVAYSPDGRRIVTGSDDATARVWDAHTGSLLYVLKGGGGRIDAVAWSPDGRYIATGHYDSTARLWDAETGRELYALRGHTYYVLSVAFSPDSKYLVTAGADSLAKVWDVNSGHEVLTPKKFEHWLWSATFSPDGSRIVFGCQDDTAKIVEATTGRTILTLQGHTGNIHALAFSPDGKRIVTGSHDGTVRMWDVFTGRETLLLAHPHAVYAIAFSPDGRCIATGGLDGTVRIWNAAVSPHLLSPSP